MDLNAGVMTCGAGLVLVSYWKPLAAFLPLLGWAWMVSTIFDKDAARWYFNRRMWNVAHMGLGVLAFAVLVAFPPVLPGALGFLVAWSMMVAILVSDLALYFFLRNADDRVPEGSRWTLDFSKAIEARAGRRARSKLGAAKMVFSGPDGVLDPPAKDSTEFEVRLVAESVLRQMLDARGTSLEIFPLKDGSYGVTASVDGMQRKLEQMTPKDAMALIDVFKSAAGLDLEDHRRRQRGTMKVGEGPISLVPYSVTTQGGSTGLRLRLTVEPLKQVSMRLGELGLLESQEEVYRELIADGTGLVLLAAPPRGGRTTTMYATIKEHDAYTSNVQTLELEPEAMIEGVRHNVFDPTVDGAEYSTTLRSILRRDPDVVAVAEMLDADTAREVAQMDVDHTRLYLSMKVDDPLKAVQLFAQQVGDQKEAAGVLKGVVAQRLVRRLCPNCRVAFKPAPDQLKKLGLPADTKQIYRQSGKVLVKDKEDTCQVCGGTGYFNQMGVFAVYTFDDRDRDLIARNDLTSLRSALRQKKQPSIQQAALTSVLQGDTSVEEVLRVTSSQKPRPKKAEGSA